MNDLMQLAAPRRTVVVAGMRLRLAPATLADLADAARRVVSSRPGWRACVPLDVAALAQAEQLAAWRRAYAIRLRRRCVSADDLAPWLATRRGLAWLTRRCARRARQCVSAQQVAKLLASATPSERGRLRRALALLNGFSLGNSHRRPAARRTRWPATPSFVGRPCIAG